jgi:uncharacterized membrane protein YccC
VLIAPPPAGAGGPGQALWTAVIAAVAVTWVALAQALGRRAGALPAAPPAARPGPAPLLAVGRSPAGAGPPARDGRARLRALVRPASTRMALQMGAGLAAAFAAGHALFPAHWHWVVLTAYVVASGNRSRGDVIYKGGLRVIGAACGTLAAAFLTTAFPPGSRWALAAILVILTGGSWLRNASYAYWAGCVTATLALFYGYAGAGAGGAGLLASRLTAIACGAVIAAAAAWLVLPVKTADVLGRRLAGVLGALTANGTRGPDPARLDRAVALLDQVAPAVLARQRIGRRAASARRLILRGRRGGMGTPAPGRPAAAGLPAAIAAIRRARREPGRAAEAAAIAATRAVLSAPATRPAAGAPATRAMPGAPATLPMPGAPATRAMPGTPATRAVPGAPRAPAELRAPDGPRAPRATADAARGPRIRAARRPRPGRPRGGRTPGGNFGWTPKHFCNKHVPN